MSEPLWSMRADNGLAAHFNMPDGPSREGTMWSINLTRGEEHYVAMVKGVLADDATTATRRDAAYQAQTAMQYLNDRLNDGWHPKDAVEHTIHIGNPLGMTGVTLSPANKPWWQFW
jgi:hypothetical protein